MKTAAILCLMLLTLTCSYAGYLEDQVDYAEDRFIVKLQPETGGLDPQWNNGTVQVSDPALTALNRKWNVSKVERLFVGPESRESREFDLAGYWRFWVSAPLSRSSLEIALADYAAATIVEHVEPVGRFRLDYTPNDPNWNVQQWYLRNTAGDHDIDAVEGWDVERGDSTAILGITDTGVMRTHPDLLAHIWRNWAEKNGVTGVDDDGNGFIDDSTGWDFVTGVSGCDAGEDCSTPDNNPSDFNGHGTHVSGIAAAVTNNSTGIAGIAGGGGTEQGARIMALRIGYSAGGGGYVGMDFAAQAFNYGRIKGAHAFNCSWGNNNSGGLGAATDAAVSAGIVICVAAGNANNSTASYLAGRTDCIAVAATDEGDVKASWSSYGSWVDVSAPGVNIYSTYNNGSYVYMDGTSMATPCVTGEVGLIKSRVPSWTRPQIMDACTSAANCDNIYDENPSWVGLLGKGRINLNLALLSTASITVTSPNGGESWIEGSSQTVTWTSSNVTGNVNIELNRSYPGGAWEAIAMNTANDGTQPWNPVTLPASTAARIRVTSVSNGTISDVSDANFSIIARTITVTSPNGGETWIVGDVNNVTWTSTGLSENVRIEINRTYPSASWTDIIASTANDGTHPWTVTSPTGSTTRVRISGAVTTTVKDTSDANFAIGIRTITVTVPNGGETWPVGSLQTVTWTSQNVTGTVNIQLNRGYPGPTWENIALGTTNDGSEPWTVTIPATTTARVRVVSVSYATVGDSSNANFSITTPNNPPTIAHDPLDDQAVQPFVVTAIVTDDAGGFVTRMFYRLQGGVNYDSLLLAATGNPNEYSVSVNGLAADDWEYFLRVRDIGNLTAQTPLAPFTVASSCGTEYAYDDGTAESSQWSASSVNYRWAVKFDPPATPFLLCSGRIGISAINPNNTHTALLVEVFAADGLGGTPGTLLYSKTVGGIGNVIGGVPTNPDNWATVLFRDGSGNPLSLTGSYFIAVSNPVADNYEAFLHDGSTYQGHSYVYVPCDDVWYNENSGDPSARLGNRLIRASGFGLTAPQIVVHRVGDNIQLDWQSTGAPYYRIYSDTVPNGAFTTQIGSTSGTTFTDVNPLGTIIKFYLVKASTVP